ncbi:hypothetical protein [Streptomyces viridochromogenes]|uniref:Uncharacterized protein n=1 Tax=Streptomyces viridochromogenes Tue57 TaxID=1160705 RepID=L8PDH2_STRVR|nr:hypothetical protein [Streptomyces viridochromogenes]ELS54475.1 hypothetical protein STVIR_4534 [Streptomyces viridochromogenes Tue57]
MLRSPWTTWTHGRRCALIGASAAVVCLGGVLAARGGGGGDGYVATGSAGGPPRVSGTAVAPTGEVTLVPLDEPAGGEGSGLGGTRSGNTRGAYGSQAPAFPERTERAAPRPSQAVGPAATPTPTDSSAPPRSSPAPSAPSAPSSPAAPAAPAQLTVSEPTRKPTDKRWCEKVTVAFHNSGGTAVRSGTVTFGTHIIGALGIDWATVESTHELPAPIGAGAREERTWTVCVEAWRVPLGMHIETRDASVRWEQ